MLQTYWHLALSPRRRSQYVRGASRKGDDRCPREWFPVKERIMRGQTQRLRGWDHSHRLRGISVLPGFCHKRPIAWTSLRSPYHRQLHWSQGPGIGWKECFWCNSIWRRDIYVLTAYTSARLLRWQQDGQNERLQLMRLDGRECLPWAPWGGGECPDQNILWRYNDIQRDFRRE